MRTDRIRLGFNVKTIAQFFLHMIIKQMELESDLLDGWFVDLILLLLPLRLSCRLCR